MRNLALAAGLVIFLTPCSWAQAPSDSTILKPRQSISQLAEDPFARPTRSIGPTSTGVARAMTATEIGAVIGAGAGIAAGIGVVLASCEAEHCGTSSYVTAAAYVGALGAGIGAVIGSNFHLSYPRTHPTVSLHRHVYVSPVIATEAKGGRVTVQF